MAPTMKDVARHAGVSIKTVSRVLNNSNEVRPTTRLRVQQTMKNPMMDDVETCVSLNGHQHLSALAKAYQDSGRETYLHTILKLWSSWYQQAPPPTIRRTEGPWRTLEVGSRAWRSWPVLLHCLADTPLFQKKMAFDLLRRYLESSLYLLANQGGGMHNWFQMESTGLAVAAAVLPDFPLRSYIYEIGAERLLRSSRACFLKDGMQFECSPVIHSYPFAALTNFIAISRGMGQEPHPELLEIYRRAADVFAHISQPNFVLPPVQDASPQHEPAQRSARQALAVEHNKEWQYVASQGQTGTPPAETSAAFPSAGYYVMRESWQSQSLWLLFDGGYFGHNHQHEDKLNFVLYGHGRPLIGDPGIYHFRPDGFEKFFRSTRGHNLLTIDGKEQCRYRFGQEASFPDPDAFCFFGSATAFVQGQYNDGFTTIGRHSREQSAEDWEPDLIHRRSIFHPWNGFYLLHDRVEGPDRARRCIRQWWQPAPITEKWSKDGIRPVQIELGSAGEVFTRERSLANVSIVPLQAPDDLTDDCGAVSPEVLGWYALYGKQPSHTVSHVYNHPLPLSLFTILIPQPAGSANPYDFTREDYGQYCYIRAAAGDHSDHILVSHAEGAVDMMHGLLSGHGVLLWIRTTLAGDPMAGAVIQGTRLEWNAKELWRSSVPDTASW